LTFQRNQTPTHRPTRTRSQLFLRRQVICCEYSRPGP
jgi:hypothetical protein